MPTAINLPSGFTFSSPSGYLHSTPSDATYTAAGNYPTTTNGVNWALGGGSIWSSDIRVSPRVTGVNFSGNDATVTVNAGQAFQAGDLVSVDSAGNVIRGQAGQPIIGVATMSNVRTFGNIDPVEVRLWPQGLDATRMTASGGQSSAMGSQDVAHPIPEVTGQFPEYLGRRFPILETASIRAREEMTRQEDASIFESLLNSVNTQPMTSQEPVGVSAPGVEVGVSPDAQHGDGSRWDEI